MNEDYDKQTIDILKDGLFDIMSVAANPSERSYGLIMAIAKSALSEDGGRRGRGRPVAGAKCPRCAGPMKSRFCEHCGPRRGKR